MIGDIKSRVVGGQATTVSPVSAYQPGAAEREIIFRVKRAYQDGDTVINKPFDEFDGKSMIQRMNQDQRAWLSYNGAPPVGEDDWRWTGVRPMTRNKVISTAAHLTSQLLFPNVFAQDEFQKEDKEAANVMKELVEWNIRNSNYETTFLYGVISGLVNPVSYWKVDYLESWQEMWSDEKKRVKVLDDVYSGIQNALIPPEEILIGNPYQFELQKQDFVIHKRRISYGEAEARHGGNPMFKHVSPGVKSVLGEDAVFYDVDDINDDLVEEVCYKNRRADEELYLVNGVFMGESTEYNPMYHRTYGNKPKYNIVKYGAEPIDSMRFFYYKSLVSKLANDQELVNREWQMYMDAGFLATFPPTVTMGAGKVDKSVISPATTTDLPANAKIEPLNIANPAAALASLREAERSLTESSIDPQGAGTQQGPEKTRGEVMLLQQNMQTNLGIMGKMVVGMVKDVGALIVDDVVRYQTIAETDELTGDMTYRSFVVQGHVKGGRDVSTQINFTDRLLGAKMTDKEKRRHNLRLYEQAGEGTELYEVNPEAFANLQYRIVIDADALLQRNDAFERALKLEIYDRALQNPLIQQDAESLNKLTRDLLFEPIMKGEAAQYLPNIEKIAQQVVPGGAPPGLGMSRNTVASAGKESLLNR